MLSNLIRNVPILTSIEMSLFRSPPQGGQKSSAKRKNCAVGKVENLLLVFHCSAASWWELWECRNLAVFARFPKRRGKRRKPAFGFSRFPHAEPEMPVCVQAYPTRVENGILMIGMRLAAKREVMMFISIS